MEEGEVQIFSLIAIFFHFLVDTVLPGKSK